MPPWEMLNPIHSSVVGRHHRHSTLVAIASSAPWRLVGGAGAPAPADAKGLLNVLSALSMMESDYPAALCSAATVPARARTMPMLQSAFPSCLHSRASLRATLSHHAAPVQYQPTPRSAVLHLAPGRSGEATAALWAARKSRAHGGRPAGEAGAGAADGGEPKYRLKFLSA